MTAPMAADASVPSRPLPRNAQVVCQAKNSQSRACSWPAAWKRYTTPAASTSSAAATVTLRARVKRCAR